MPTQPAHSYGKLMWHAWELSATLKVDFVKLLSNTHHIISQTFAMAPINQSSSAPHITNTIVVDNVG